VWARTSHEVAGFWAATPQQTWLVAGLATSVSQGTDLNLNIQTCDFALTKLFAFLAASA